jgi:hypothetical protein
LDLSVKNKTDIQIELQPIKTQTGELKKDEINNILFSLKLQPDERNMEIVKSLINQNISLSKENVQKIISTVSTLGLDVKSAVFFVANNLEKINGAVNILSQLSKNEFALSQKLDYFINQLIKTFNKEDFNRITDRFNTVIKNTQTERIINNQNIIYNAINNYDGSTKATITISNLIPAIS